MLVYAWSDTGREKKTEWKIEVRWDREVGKTERRGREGRGVLEKRYVFILKVNEQLKYLLLFNR